MNIYIETTSVPNILKFILESSITSENYEFDIYSNTMISPLSAKLFQLGYITKVYINSNFVALQKDDTITWESVNEYLKQLIQEAYNKDEIIILPTKIAPITIYTELTPNPNVLKFVGNIKLTDAVLEFKTVAETENAPLVTQLFRYPFVKEIFITQNYISVTKKDDITWETITQELRDEISKLLQNGVPVIKNPEKIISTHPIIQENKQYSPDEEAIKAIIDQYIKPAVESDGGNIELISYNPENQLVEVMLQGACSGCPSSSITLKNGIENLLKNMMPEKIKEVVAINA